MKRVSVRDLRCDFARVSTSQFGARTLDVMHVAAVVELEADLFVTFDRRRAALVMAAGLKT